MTTIHGGISLDLVPTLKKLRCGVRRRSTEGVELASRDELVGEAKVGDLDVHVGVEQQVFRLEIPVHDPLLMKVLHREHDLTELSASLFLFHPGLVIKRETTGMRLFQRRLISESQRQMRSQAVNKFQRLSSFSFHKISSVKLFPFS